MSNQDAPRRRFIAIIYHIPYENQRRSRASNTNKPPPQKRKEEEPDEIEEPKALVVYLLTQIIFSTASIGLPIN